MGIGYFCWIILMTKISLIVFLLFSLCNFNIVTPSSHQTSLKSSHHLPNFSCTICLVHLYVDMLHPFNKSNLALAIAALLAAESPFSPAISSALGEKPIPCIGCWDEVGEVGKTVAAWFVLPTLLAAWAGLPPVEIFKCKIDEEHEMCT